MSSNTTFGAGDYVVFSLMLTVSASIGIYYRFTGGKQRTTKEYLLADKNMSPLPVAFSLMASFMSAITLLGVSSENYIYGTQFVVINIAYIFGTLIAAHLYLPVFFKLQATSAYEYLELRFGKITRLVASTAFILQMVLYMSIVLYAPALALNAVTDFPKWASILSVGLVCTFYSTIGGMKAVLWTDLFQSLLMFAAIFAVLINGALDAGGLSPIWRIAEKGQRIEFFNFDPDPTTRHTVWTQIIGGMFTYTTIYGVNQAQVQRLMTVKDLSTSQLALYLNWPILTILSLTTSFSGLVIYSKYYDCDPLLNGRISTQDQLLPRYVMDYLSFRPGFAGLFVSGIFSAALSTVSSAVNSLAAVTLEDFIKPRLSNENLTDARLAIMSKLLALFYGIICIALTYVAEKLGGVLQASLTIFGVVGGPLLGLFTLGMFFTRSNQKGAVIGFISGLVFCFWIGFGASFERPFIPKLPQSTEGCSFSNDTETVTNVSSIISQYNFTNLFFINEPITVPPTDQNLEDRNSHILYIYRLSYMWVAPIGFTVVIVVGIIVSLLTSRSLVSNPDLLTPPLAKYHAQVLLEKRVEYASVGTTDDSSQSFSIRSRENHVNITKL